MLKLLNISNFAVVSNASIEFGEGLNLLTGETGSGKSIVVDALGLLVGGRASSDIVRTGASAAHIEGVFAVDRNDELTNLAAEAGIDISDGEILIRREVSDRSRGRVYVNDRLATLGLLKAMRPMLIDIHGQGDQQTLLYPDSHVRLLDEFGGLGRLQRLVGEAFERYGGLRRELNRLVHSEAERLRSLDVVGFQIAEIDKASLSVEEDERLEAERSILVNAEKLVQLSAESYGLLYEDSGSVLPLLAQVERRIDALSQFDARFAAYSEQMKGAKYVLEDLAFFLRDYLQDVDFSPERLKALDDRLLEIDRLKRKYGTSIAGILESVEQMRADFEALNSAEERAASMSQALAVARDEYLEVARELSLARHDAAHRLEERVIAELRELAMEQCTFEVRISVADAADAQAFTAGGIDSVEFFVATNPGEDPKPLVKIASGGEVSRLMLALKTVSAPPEIPRTLVFDEVDVGIGGRVSEAIGLRLAALSAGNQVICVTHQAQIARFADVHFTVRKALLDERTETSVTRLDRRGQIEELARMIGGADVTVTARRHARELLKAK